MAFSPDGRYLALAGAVGAPYDYCREDEGTCKDGFLHAWDLRSGRRVFASRAKFPRVMSLVFSRDGTRLITGHDLGEIKVWDTQAWNTIAELKCCRRTWIRAVALAPDGRTLAAGGQNGEVMMWDGDGRNPRILGGHLYGVSSLAFAADGHLLSSGDDQHIWRWHVQSGARSEFSRAAGRAKAHRGMIKTVALLGNGERAVSGAYWEGGTTKAYEGVAPPDHVLRLWDVVTGRALRSYPLTWGVRCCIQVLNDGRRVAFLKATSWDERPVLNVFDLDTGVTERELAPSMGESFHAVAMRAGGELFAINIGDGHYLLWSRTSGRVLAQLVSAAEGWAVVSSDGRLDFSDDFNSWPCRHNIRSACAGGTPATATPGLLARLIEAPR